jgi:hypothetical protein
MDTRDLWKPGEKFSMLSQAEQFEICGGNYKGPVSPYIWLKVLLEKLRNGEE